MSFMLWTVVWTVAILFVVITVQALAGDLHNGAKWGLGPRDTSKDDTVFIGRAKRTAANHMEGMLAYVPLALVAHMAGLSGDLIIKGGWLYIIARAVYPLTYWTGIPVIRSLVWFGSVAGTLMVFFGIVLA